MLVELFQDCFRVESKKLPSIYECPETGLNIHCSQELSVIDYYAVLFFSLHPNKWVDYTAHRLGVNIFGYYSVSIHQKIYTMLDRLTETRINDHQLLQIDRKSDKKVSVQFSQECFNILKNWGYLKVNVFLNDLKALRKALRTKTAPVCIAATLCVLNKECTLESAIKSLCPLYLRQKAEQDLKEALEILRLRGVLFPLE